MQSQYEFFIFGMPIFQNYYTVHQMGTNASMTFIPGLNTRKGAPQKG
jgi:hypothetical protein